ncbi:MAG TPA: RidA family protein [Firmicutes bacterium]|nr:RidA family protein [Bacillota bacterium]
MKEIILTDKAPAPIGPYSQGIAVGGLIFFSGQIAIDPAVGKITATDIEGQTVQVLSNISALLAAASLTPADVVKTTVFVRNMGDFAKVNAIYAQTFDKEPPARSCVEVSALPSGALVEIEVIAKRN